MAKRGGFPGGAMPGKCEDTGRGATVLHDCEREGFSCDL